jgi:uncharacterized protein
MDSHVTRVLTEDNGLPSPPVKSRFRERYGRWAVVAGASEGLGAAFAADLAGRGMNLVLLARRAELLAAVARRIAAEHAIETRVLACDVAAPAFVAELARATDDLEVGVAVYNAAYSPIGPLVERPLDDLVRVVDVNVRAPLLFSRALLPPMVTRARGALVLMSSLAGLFGAPRLAAYAASKAFNIVLGQSLWGELAPRGIDVLVSCAGAIRTPGYAHAAQKEAPGTLDAAEVARRTLDALGRGPVIVPGAVNKLASLVVGRILTRRGAVRVMSASTRTLG